MMVHDTSKQRRAYMVVILGLILVFILGFGALAIDVSMVVAAKHELRTATDAAALATIDMVTNMPADTKIEDLKDAAEDYAARFLPINPVMGSGLHLPEDMRLGRTWPQGPDRRYLRFNPLQGDQTEYNALMLKSNLDELDPILGSIFGRERYEISATSFVVMKPMNVVLVLDASDSMRSDSPFMNGHLLMDVLDGERGFDRWRTNMDQLWEAFPTQPYNNEYGSWDFTGYHALQDGPVYGEFMESFGYGTLDKDIDSLYRPREFRGAHGDTGLLYLPQGVTWDGGSLDADAAEQAGELFTILVVSNHYSIDEGNVIASATDNWMIRVKLALGLLGWNSGMEPGFDEHRWEYEGWDPADGNGDTIIDMPGELVDLGIDALPSDSPGYSWDEYVDKVRFMDYSAGTEQTRFADFSYCYGVKTMIQALFIRIPSDEHAAEGFREAPVMPWHATRLAIHAFLDGLGALDNSDRVGLVLFGSESCRQMGLQDTEGLSNVGDALDANAPYRGMTNIGDGLLDAIEILTTYELPLPPVDEDCTEWELDPDRTVPPQERFQNVIVLMTDGFPNMPGGQPVLGYEHTISAVQQAVSEEIRIHTFNIGTYADLNLCTEISTMTGGFCETFLGDYITQQEEMTEQFNRLLGGTRELSQVVGYDLDVLGRP